MKMPIIDRVVLGALRWRLERFYSPGLADGACELFKLYAERVDDILTREELRERWHRAKRARELRDLQDDV